MYCLAWNLREITLIYFTLDWVLKEYLNTSFSNMNSFHWFQMGKQWNEFTEVNWRRRPFVFFKKPVIKNIPHPPFCQTQTDFCFPLQRCPDWNSVNHSVSCFQTNYSVQKKWSTFWSLKFGLWWSASLLFAPSTFSWSGRSPGKRSSTWSSPTPTPKTSGVWWLILGEVD